MGRLVGQARNSIVVRGHSHRPWACDELSELEAIGAAWREWASDENGWLSMPHGELLGH